jgi:hypothetical protein
MPLMNDATRWSSKFGRLNCTILLLEITQAIHSRGDDQVVSLFQEKLMIHLRVRCRKLILKG